MKSFLVLCCAPALLSALVLAVPAYDAHNPRENEIDPQPIDNTISNDPTWIRIGREVGKCLSSEDSVSCVALKTITAMQRVSRQQSIEILPGMYVVREEQSTNRDAKALTEAEIERSLPMSFSEKTNKLMDLILDSAMEFLSTHSLKFKIPAESEEMSRAMEEGRKKNGGNRGKHKMMGPLIMAIGAKLAFLLPLAIIATKFLALKALVVAKLALVIAAVVAFQCLGTSGLFRKGSSGAGHQISYSAPSAAADWSSTNSAYPYARSMSVNDAAEKAQNLAYSGHVAAQ